MIASLIRYHFFVCALLGINNPKAQIITVHLKKGDLYIFYESHRNCTQDR